MAIHPAGADAISIDEWWLLRLRACLADGDRANARALIGFRVRPEHRRAMLALADALIWQDGDAGRCPSPFPRGDTPPPTLDRSVR